MSKGTPKLTASGRTGLYWYHQIYLKIFLRDPDLVDDTTGRGEGQAPGQMAGAPCHTGLPARPGVLDPAGQLSFRAGCPGPERDPAR